MARMTYVNDDPIYALCTVWGVSAIAVYRVCGSGSIRLANKLLKKKIVVPRTKAVVFRKLYYEGKEIDEAVLTLFAKGFGYTREECVEFSVHGSVSVISALAKALEAAGFRQALRGEFTYRALRNGVLSVIQAESVLSLIESENDDQRMRALETLGGALDDTVSKIRSELLQIASAFELQLDYSEDEYDEAVSFPLAVVKKVLGEIESLLKGYELAKKRDEGISIVLFGRANAGKSTLFNRLLRQDRSITSPVKGTTRDYVGEEITISGYKATLYDTAGYEDGLTGPDGEAAKRSLKLASECDIIVFMESVDAFSSDDLCRKALDAIEGRGKPVIRVLSKSDMCECSKNAASPQNRIRVSAKTGEGVAELVTRIGDMAAKALRTDGASSVLATERQRRVFEKMASRLRLLLKRQDAIEICAALARECIALADEIAGKDPSGISEEVLEAVFSRFCVGK